MGFTNGVSSIDIGNGAALASEIGGANNAAGTRLVNNAATGSSKTFAGPGDTWLIDCTNAVSLALGIQASSTGATPGSVTLQLSWFADAALSHLVYQETFEANCGDASSGLISTLLVDRCLSPYCYVTYPGFTGVTGVTLTVLALPQTVPVDTRRITEQDNAYTGDGLLGQFTDPALGAGVSGPLHVFPLTNGWIQLRTSASTQPGQFLFSWGYGGLQQFKISCAAGADTDLLIPAANRPLTCKITNEGSATSGFAVSAWTSNA